MTDPETGTDPGGGPEAGAALVDTHCHLFLMQDEAAAVVEASRQAGIGRLICVGIDAESSRRSLEFAQSFRGVFATAGVHPHSASDFDRGAGSEIEGLLADPMVVAIGETGLDYHRNLSPPEDQRRAFRIHIALGRESGKPLVVHVREGWADALSILDEEGADRVVLHCFSGDRDVVSEAAARGYFVSFAGNISYPSAGPLREAAAGVPAERLLVETDSPFLTPQAFRGRDNSPVHLTEVIQAVAEARGQAHADVAAGTAEAARAAFSLPV